MGFERLTSTVRPRIGVWVAIVGLFCGLFAAAEGADETLFLVKPVEAILPLTEDVVTVRVISTEPLFYRDADGKIGGCAVKMRGTVLEVLKGDLEPGTPIFFLAGYNSVTIEGLTATIQAPDVEVSRPEVDLQPTEFLVFLTTGKEGLDAAELENIDQIKTSYRMCLVRRYQWSGYHTVFFDSTSPFNRWAERQFGGKWISFRYGPAEGDEKIEWRLIQWGPTDDHVFGVRNWEAIRAGLLRVIRQQEE